MAIFLNFKLMKKRFLFFFFFVGFQIFAQNINPKSDEKYLEDQFYLGITYNILVNKSEKIKQHSVSHSFMGGFIRDIPLNKKRNIALGVGVGYSLSQIYTNFGRKSAEENTKFRIISFEKERFTLNKFRYQTFDIPLEFRWRTSTPEDYAFWRFYLGTRFSYIFSSAYLFENHHKDFKSKGIPEKFLYQIYASIGYNKWNLIFQYALNPIFSNQRTTEGVFLESNIASLGIIFYIL